MELLSVLKALCVSLERPEMEKHAQLFGFLMMTIYVNMQTGVQLACGIPYCVTMNLE